MTAVPRTHDPRNRRTDVFARPIAAWILGVHTGRYQTWGISINGQRIPKITAAGTQSIPPASNGFSQALCFKRIHGSITCARAS